jgi:hypothetical protein
MVESHQSKFFVAGSVQNGCLLTADEQGNFDPEADLHNLQPLTYHLPPMNMAGGVKHVVAWD